jgi:hypothetical protein
VVAAAPRGLLSIIDFPEVKNLPLDDFVAHCPVIFNNTPVAMFFSILESRLGAKKQSSHAMKGKSPIKRLGRHYRKIEVSTT